MLKLYPFLFLIFISVLSSCERYNIKIAEYNIDVLDTTDKISLKDWNVLGLVKYTDTSLNYYLNKDHLISQISENSFVKNPYKFRFKHDSDLFFSHSCIGDFFHSEDSIVDYRQMNRSKILDLKGVKGATIYYYCKINSKTHRKTHLLTRSTGGIRIWLNGNEIYSTLDEWRFEMSYREFVTLTLSKGENVLVIKQAYNSNDVFVFDGEICNKNKIIESYEITNYLLMSNPLFTDSLRFGQDRAKDIDTSFTLNIADVNKKIVFSKNIAIGLPLAFLTKSIPSNHAYLCSVNIGGHIISQPLFKGNPDTAIMVFKNKRMRLSEKSEIGKQVDVLLFRSDTLLKHSSRQTDWYWPYKIALLLYELENTFNNAEKKLNISYNSFGIQLKSFFSRLDNTAQYYMLISPDNLEKTEKVPLVVVIKTMEENHHHFLLSRSIADYWSLSWAKYLANKYRYVILLASARLYVKDDLIPMAEQEIFQAVEEAKKYYNIDNERIFLHGTCGGGYRALKLACHFPDKFAAIGLYAPSMDDSSLIGWTKNNSPNELFGNLGNIPIFIHFDPFDKHTPPSKFSRFIDLCQHNGLNIKMSSVKNSSWNYSSVLVGKETFTFFKDKKLSKAPLKIKLQYYNGRYNTSWWLACLSANNAIESNAKASFVKEENKITVTGSNLSGLSIKTSELSIDKRKPLIVEYNRQTRYQQISKDSVLHINLSKICPKYDFIVNDKIVADVFAEPFLFVVDSVNKTKEYKTFIDSIKYEYEKYLFSKCPIRSADQISERDLTTRNIFFIGNNFNNRKIMDGLLKLPLKVDHEFVQLNEKKFEGNAVVFQAIFVSPFNSKKLVVVYGANNNRFAHIMKYPWKNGLENFLIKY